MTEAGDVPLLEVESVVVRFGGLQALSDVSLSVRPRRLTGLIGPNGAGKTTLFNVIAGVQRPTAGAVKLHGRDISRLSPSRRASLGIARTYQRLEVFGTLSVRENVLVAAESCRRHPRGRSHRDVVDRLLADLELADLQGEVTDSLPTGTQRRVELARALACRPDLLLLDEVASGLSSYETETMAAVLRTVVSQGIGVLLVEHDMPFVMSLCEEVSMLDHGRLVVTGTPEQVQADETVQAAYLGRKRSAA